MTRRLEHLLSKGYKKDNFTITHDIDNNTEYIYLKSNTKDNKILIGTWTESFDDKRENPTMILETKLNPIFIPEIIIKSFDNLNKED